ncbi:MAG: N(2)-acetyl-L-2,4-diaminobutanoate deacetylase DoeB [Alphaproteobacteria bacterium]|nr:N(2)-acetyl-L-2,4-diaminobutanoate deacetylase DoeB [Alphaproteobacteria bacterium]MDX5368336.1 N(2)-acetyl-L-2,4-diaminobutanoate deacetylase DoeB [Alphaproteobacteria bacterium]MDX5463131.1 N(2)-acetyl-L-2,4-diaminobutanoate deacetylase DoeB [Alphaproteobacteria bacterium]
MTAPSPITPTIDFDADGAHYGHLRLPYSRDDSAWGHVMIPVACLKNGDGPTVLLTGGNHGDEYEGPLALAGLSREIDVASMTGRAIFLPFMNHPAVMAATRTSPIDGGNLNRLFPGRPDGTVTQKIADYVARHLVPLADLVLDIHSGGRTLDFLPFAASHILPDKAQEAACAAARDAFGAPYAMSLLEIDAAGMLDTTVEEMGKVFVTTELGGGGTATARTVAIARTGVRNVLAHAGILPGPVEPARSVRLDMPSGDCFVFADAAGLVEPCADLGDRVEAGDVIARIHAPDRLGAAPVEHRAKLSGLLAGRHFPGKVQMGDCLAVVAVPED